MLSYIVVDASSECLSMISFKLIVGSGDSVAKGL